MTCPICGRDMQEAGAGQEVCPRTGAVELRYRLWRCQSAVDGGRCADTVHYEPLTPGVAGRSLNAALSNGE